jgi:hypothetical protein
LHLATYSGHRDRTRYLRLGKGNTAMLALPAMMTDNVDRANEPTRVPSSASRTRLGIL